MQRQNALLSQIVLFYMRYLEKILMSQDIYYNSMWCIHATFHTKTNQNKQQQQKKKELRK